MTAGRLGVEGLVLQLRLRKVDLAEERDHTAGTWHAYHIVGGAVTMSDATPELLSEQAASSTDSDQTALNF